MRFARMFFVPALVAGAIAVGACSSSSAPELTGEQLQDPQLVTGAEVYKANCARCHGNSGGGGAGPKLADGAVVKHFADPVAQEKVVRDGRGTMPAWDKKLTDDEITSVVRYTREVL